MTVKKRESVGAGGSAANAHPLETLRQETPCPDRYVVLFEDERGQEAKFITNSGEMKQILDKVAEVGELPFRTTIVRKRMAENKCKYCFT